VVNITAAAVLEGITMPANVTPEQLSFWRELMAPFHPLELSEAPARCGKKTPTYMDKRALSNPLDSVCGPHGWYPEFEAVNWAYKCRPHILVPTGNGSWVFMHKQDGAGFEKMGSLNNTTGELEHDVDDDGKSAYANALPPRGPATPGDVGRHCCQKGMPTSLDPIAVVQPGGASAPVASRSQATVDRDFQEVAGNVQPHDFQAAAHRHNAGTPPAGRWRGSSACRIPRLANSAFACSKEKVFETHVVDHIQEGGRERGWGAAFAVWTEEQVETIPKEAIAVIEGLARYKRQIDHIQAQCQGKIDPTRTRDAQAPAQPAGTHGENDPPSSQGVDVADLGKTPMFRMRHLVKSIGLESTRTELKVLFGQIASCVPIASGKMGKMLESLLGLVSWSGRGACSGSSSGRPATRRPRGPPCGATFASRRQWLVLPSRWPLQPEARVSFGPGPSVADRRA
jgi:hypothetical protein